MIKKMKWLLPVVFVISCNNDTNTVSDKPGAGEEKLVSENYCDSVNKGLLKDTVKGSPHRTVMDTINGNHVHIEYNSPGVKGRVIWGKLVPYGKVWATGAHSATTVQFSKDVEIGGKKIPSGKYGLFTIPGQEKWIFILNTRHDQHMADDYKEKEDVLRMDVAPLEHAMTQRLTYQVNKLSDTTGEISMQWEKIKIAVPFK